APRVVTAAVPGRRFDLDAFPVELQPTPRGAALDVACLIGDGPTATSGEVVGFLERRRGPQPVQVETEPGRVVVQRQADVPIRLDDLDPVRADLRGAAITPGPAEPHGALHARAIDARVAADQVRVRVDPQPLETEDLPVGVENAEEVAVVEAVVAVGHAAQRVWRLMHRKLVVRAQHRAPSTALMPRRTAAEAGRCRVARSSAGTPRPRGRCRA